MSDNENAKCNAAAWLTEIVQIIASLDAPDIDTKAEEELHQRIHEGPLSVSFRAGWFAYGQQTDAEIEECVILLSTGGPALRIYCSLNLNDWDVELQWQDWGTPWTNFPLEPHEREALRRYQSFFND